MLRSVRGIHGVGCVIVIAWVGSSSDRGRKGQDGDLHHDCRASVESEGWSG
jgi:hypothetical protein